MKTEEQLRAAIASETRTFQELRTNYLAQQLLALYDALIDSHLADLATVKPEHLAFKQGAIRQLVCLRAVLLDDSPHLSAKA